jgi:hypothetical protein
VQVPTPTTVTVAPETLQTPALEASAEKVTARPELADAETAYGPPPAVAPDGAADVNVIDCTLGAAAMPIENDCRACGAAACVASPAWFASIVLVPLPTRATAEPDTVQMPALEAPGENVGATPDESVAATTYD